MAWLKSVKSPIIDTEKKSTVISTSGGMITRPRAEYQVQWDTRRIIEEALERVTWVYRCVDAISSNAAKVPMVIRKGNSWDGELQDGEEELLYILNSKSNVGESSYVFKYRLSAQLLLSEKGVFIEVVRDKGGNISSLQILPSDFVTPLPDPKTFVSGYDFKMDVYTDAGVKRIEQHLKPEQVIWIRKPHPFDPYKAMTALPSSGIAIETDWNAKLYNRNFLLNDGRPGGLVVIKGDATEEDKEELRARFRGGPYTAGRISVITSAQGADFVDTAVTPRDAQHIETRGLTQAEILMAFGVPKSVLADASARCVDEKTEALTQRGWVNGYELTTDDMILSTDLSDGRLKWSKVKEVFRNENYSGDMYRIKNSKNDILVTPGHNWVVATDSGLELKKVENLVPKDRIITIGEAENSVEDSIYDDHFVELVGWAVTEGHFYPNEASQRNRPTYKAPYVRISQNPGENADRIEKCIRNLGGDFSITERTDNDRLNYLFNIRGELASQIMSVAPNKVMTNDFILGLTASQRELLFETMIDADGGRQKKTSSIIFAQKNPDASDAFIFLATLCGYTTSYRDEIRPYTHKGVTKDVFRRVVVVRSSKVITTQHGALTKESYDGFIWCPRTEYGTFIARREGKVFLTGNTFDNAELERLIFWQETMLPHMELIMRSLDVLLEENDLYIGLDLEKVDVLQRMDLKRKEYALREFDGGAITVDEYREETGRQALADERGKVLFRANTRIPYATIDGSEIPEMPMVVDATTQVAQPNEGRPANTTVTEQPENDPVPREDGRTPPLPNSTNK